MPTELKEIPILTLQEFTQFIEMSSPNHSDSLWYRGCGRSSYDLVPSLYRHPTIHGIEQLLELESKILDRFKQRSVPYLNRTIEGDLDYLFLMQHCGVPTRLLDWTENPFIALFFALTSAPFVVSEGNCTFAEDAAVWVLNPNPWNIRALEHLSFAGGILSPSDKKMDGYAPTSESSLMKSEPIAIFGPHNSARIVAQRGVFTIFGKNRESMNGIYTRLNFPQDSLQKLIVPSGKIDGLLQSILSIGFTDSVVFPDLDGLARETKRFFGYMV